MHNALARHPPGPSKRLTHTTETVLLASTNASSVGAVRDVQSRV
jgi:hypothetical protein